MAEAIEDLESLIEEFNKKSEEILNKRKIDELGLEDLGKLLTNLREFSGAVENVRDFSDEEKEAIKNATGELETLNSQRIIAANQRAIEIEANNTRIADNNATIDELTGFLSNVKSTTTRYQLEQLISRLQEENRDLERGNQKLQDEIDIALNGGKLELPEISENLTQTQIEEMTRYVRDVNDKKAQGIAQPAVDLEKMLGVDPKTVSRTTPAKMTEEDFKEALDEGKEHTDTSSGSDESSAASEEKEEKIETMDFGTTSADASSESDSGEETSEEEEKEKDKDKEVEKDHTVASATSTASSSDEEVDKDDKEDKGLAFEKNNPSQNVQNMIDYINKMTKDTRVKKVNNKRENMSLAQAVERGLLPKNLGEDKILEIANEMGIKANNMNHVVTDKVLDALMDDKEVKLARANLEIANKRQEQVNKNAKALETIGQMDLGSAESDALSEGIQNLAEGLTEATIEINEKNEALSGDKIGNAALAREHFDINRHDLRGDRVERLDERGTNLNNRIRKQYVELAKRMDQSEKAKGKIRQAFADYRVERVSAKIERLKRKEGRVTAKEIALMNKETDKYIAKKQKDLDRYMHRQEKLQERVDRYKDLSARRTTAEKTVKENNEGLDKLNETGDRDLLSTIERGVTHINNGINYVKMGALKSKMGRTELGHLASQAFDLRLSSARGKLQKRVESIRNSEKGTTTNLNRLAAVDLVNEMKMVA